MDLLTALRWVIGWDSAMKLAATSRLHHGVFGFARMVDIGPTVVMSCANTVRWNGVMHIETWGEYVAADDSLVAHGRRLYRLYGGPLPCLIETYRYGVGVGPTVCTDNWSQDAFTYHHGDRLIASGEIVDREIVIKYYRGHHRILYHTPKSPFREEVID